MNGVDDVEDEEEDGAVDLLDDCEDDDYGEDVLVLVSMLEDEEDEGMIDLLIVNKNGRSILVPCGGCGQGVIGLYCYSGRSAHIHVFCGDVAMRWVKRGWDICGGSRGVDAEG